MSSRGETEIGKIIAHGGMPRPRARRKAAAAPPCFWRQRAAPLRRERRRNGLGCGVGGGRRPACTLTAGGKRGWGG
eukprot:scaffold13215_cov120-Isochrysis_galbana.AAC.2